MHDARSTVVQGNSPVDEERFRAKFRSMLHRLAAKHGGAKMALALGVSERQMANLYNGSLPGLHRAWNLLTLDPTAMDEIAALFGAQIRPATSETACDFDTIARMATAAAHYVGVMADGRRDHVETLELADIFRPLIARMSGIVAEAESIREPTR